MKSYWVVKGSIENWRQAFGARGIWGLEDTKFDRVFWLALAPGDLLFFHVTGKVKGLVVFIKECNAVPIGEAIEIEITEVSEKVAFAKRV